MDIQGWALSVVSPFVAAAAVGWLVKREKDIPSKVFAWLHAEWHVFSTRLDAPSQRLISSCAKATFKWADEESPNQIGADKMDKIMSALERLPAVGLLVKAQDKELRLFLQAEYDAWKAEARKNEQPPV